MCCGTWCKCTGGDAGAGHPPVACLDPDSAGFWGLGSDGGVDSPAPGPAYRFMGVTEVCNVWHGRFAGPAPGARVGARTHSSGSPSCLVLSPHRVAGLLYKSLGDALLARLDRWEPP